MKWRKYGSEVHTRGSMDSKRCHVRSQRMRCDRHAPGRIFQGARTVATHWLRPSCTRLLIRVALLFFFFTCSFSFNPTSCEPPRTRTQLSKLLQFCSNLRQISTSTHMWVSPLNCMQIHGQMRIYSTWIDAVEFGDFRLNMMRSWSTFVLSWLMIDFVVDVDNFQE